MNKDLERQIEALEHEIATLTGSALPDVTFMACGGWIRPLPELDLVEGWLRNCGLNTIGLRIGFDVRSQITFPRIQLPNGHPFGQDWYEVVIPGRIHPERYSIDWCHPLLTQNYDEWKMARGEYKATD